MILRITDGTTTIDLVGGTNSIYLAEDYVPSPPEVTETEFTAEALYDGGELVAATRRNVTESVPVTLVASSRTTIFSALNSIETLFEQALTRQTKGVGSRVYVEYRKADSGDTYRSEIMRGTVAPAQDTAEERWWAAGSVQAIVAWKRRPYWEGAEAALTLTNTHGSGSSGITVYNHDDSGQDNYVAIAAGAVAGGIPSPAKLSILNSYNVAARLFTVHIGHNVWSNPASLTHILEGENSDYSVGGSTVTSSSCSGGSYESVTWTGDTSVQAIRWALSTALLDACAGGWFRLLGRFQVTASGAKLTPKVTFPSGTPLTVVGEAQEVTLGSGTLQDLGVLQLPPWLRGESSLYPVDLTIYARKTGGGTFGLDYIQLTPLDSYRVLTPRGYGAAYNVTLVDDGPTGSVYTTGWGSSYKTGHYIPTGGPVMLFPGRAQRLYFLGTNDSSGCEIDRTYTVSVSYRPRRLTL